MTKPSKAELEADAAKAAAEAAAAFEAQLAKTERLRALRMARDEADVKAKAKPAAAKPARKTRRAVTQQ